MKNLDSILKGKDITLPTKVLIVKAIVCPIDMYRCKRWTIKKAECWRIDAFKLWYWRRLEGLLDCKEIKPGNPKGNQPWIFTGRTDAEAEALIPWPPEAKSWLIGIDSHAGKESSQRRRGQQRITWLDSITTNLSRLQEIVEGRRTWWDAVHGVTKSKIQHSDYIVITTQSQ